MKEETLYKNFKYFKLSCGLIYLSINYISIFNIPIIEAENVPISWYSIIYWATLVSTSIISGMMIRVILILYSVVENLLAIIGLDRDHHLASKGKMKKILTISRK